MKTLKMLGYLSLLLNATFLIAKDKDTNSENGLRSNVVQANNIKWGYLNPLRGDKSPGAAELWGDRTKDRATGMLVKFNKGFSSPPHIHNISYRGIVIDGLMHNDDPTASELWMPQGSFWTQPAGEDHITAAAGQTNLIYLEIDSGPYLVKPSDNAFNNGEAPVNLHINNMAWLHAKDVAFINASSGVEVTPLWGSNVDGELGGVLLKLPADFNGTLKADANEFRAVVIKGQLNYQSKETRSSTHLSAGSYFDSQGQFGHQLSAKSPTLLYVRTDGRFSID